MRIRRPVVVYGAGEAMAESKGKASPELVLDPDLLIDEILARKGPQTYKDGLSEDNWEEVGGAF